MKQLEDKVRGIVRQAEDRKADDGQIRKTELRIFSFVPRVVGFHSHG